MTNNTKISSRIRRWLGKHRKVTGSCVIVIGIAALILTKVTPSSELSIASIRQIQSGSKMSVKVTVKNHTKEDFVDVCFILHAYDAKGKELAN